ncbi:hypothetical protein JOL79_20255 [Microbispora sp. RL4-1S]|uniref:Secreted protein n=1 Tax=Microbispora oryzae TaxID=2806554 RepID=A0A940WSC2_9ACTN|nr:hypothetical protein [Microbispora oryzae]MBP2706146.1 hypothetical protein [Microbispora oryzae]
MKKLVSAIAAVVLAGPVAALALASPASATSYFTCSPEDYHVTYSAAHWEWYTYLSSEVIDVPQHNGWGYVYRRHYDHWTYWVMVNPVSGAPIFIDNHQALTCTT